jgi:hypothetical protein
MNKLIIFDQNIYTLIDLQKTPKVIAIIFREFITKVVEGDNKYNQAKVLFSQNKENAFLYFDQSFNLKFSGFFIDSLSQKFGIIKGPNVSISDFLDLAGNTLFSQPAKEIIIETAKTIFNNVMPSECEYFYNKQISSVGDLIFRNKLVYDHLKKILVKFKIRNENINEIIIIYTTNYLSKHNNIIVDLVADNSSTVILLKNSSENVIVTDNFLYFNNLDDIIRFYYLFKLTILSIQRKFILHISPDLISLTALVEFLGFESDATFVHILSEANEYGTHESKALALILDKTFPNFMLHNEDAVRDEIILDPINRILLNAISHNISVQKNLTTPISDKSKLTFVVTAHNENYMAIRSLWNLVGVITESNLPSKDFEILCLLDKSSEDTNRAIYYFQSYLLDMGINILRIVKTDYGNLSKARNYAISLVKSPYVSIHDADDFISLNWLQELANKSDNFTVKNLIFHPKVNYYFGTDERIMWSPCMIDDHVTIKWSNILVDNFWTSCSAGYRGLYEENPYIPIDKAKGIGFEDWSWNVKMITNGFEHIAIPDTTLFVRLKYQNNSLNKQSIIGGLIPDLNGSLYNIFNRVSQ